MNLGSMDLLSYVRKKYIKFSTQLGKDIVGLRYFDELDDVEEMVEISQAVRRRPSFHGLTQ